MKIANGFSGLTAKSQGKKKNNKEVKEKGLTGSEVAWLVLYLGKGLQNV